MQSPPLCRSSHDGEHELVPLLQTDNTISEASYGMDSYRRNAVTRGCMPEALA